MNNIKINIETIKKDIKESILSSNYKNQEMFVLMYKEYTKHDNEKFFIAQAFNVGKINSKNLSIAPKYENGLLMCDILMQGIYKIGEFYFKYDKKHTKDFIDEFQFNLTHYIFNYIKGDYGKIARIGHRFNYKSRMRMVELNFSEEQVEEYLNLCKEKNWDCKLIEQK